MALRIEKAFGPKMDHLMRMQLAYDLARARGARAKSPFVRSGARVEEVLMRLQLIEKAEGNYSAYVPDLPGCVATGPTVEAVKRGIRDAIRFTRRS